MNERKLRLTDNDIFAGTAKIGRYFQVKDDERYIVSVIALVEICEEHQIEDQYKSSEWNAVTEVTRSFDSYEELVKFFAEQRYTELVNTFDEKTPGFAVADFRHITIYKNDDMADHSPWHYSKEDLSDD